MGSNQPADILIVDDDQLIRKIIADCLDSPEYRIHESAGGQDVIALIERLHPALVILDIVMPDIDGFQICAAVRESSWGEDIPIAILSVLTDSRSVSTAFQVGATDVFPKPVNTILIQNRVRMLIQKNAAPPPRQPVPQDIFNEITDPLIIYRNDLTIEWANDRARLFFDLPVADMLEKPCYDICPTNRVSQCSSCSVKRSVLENSLQSGVKRHPNGTFWGVRVYPVLGKDGRCLKVVQIAHDITEKVKLQEDGVHARNLATLGSLATEIAHEVSSRIRGVVNFSEMLVRRLEDREDLLDYARKINHDGERIATVVDSLLSFARRNGGTASEVDAEALIRETMPLVENSLLNDDIDVVFNILTRGVTVNVLSQEMQQVFISLFNNARDALNARYPQADPHKQIVVTVATRRLDERDFVVFDFLDYGIGIPAEVLDKVTQPFYTTKLGEGATGVGLSLSHKIMKKHDGDLLLESREGEYTRVSALLPAMRS